MNLANKITMARVIAVIPFIFFLMTNIVPGSKWIALGIFVLASLSDFVDGAIARKFNMISNFGKFMDPIADKLLVCSALIGLLSLYNDQNKYFVYLVLLIIARDFVISGFRLVASDQGIVIPANWYGKVKTTLQMIMIGFLIANLPSIVIVSYILEATVAVFTVLSLVISLVQNRQVFQDMDKGKLSGKKKQKGEE